MGQLVNPEITLTRRGLGERARDLRGVSVGPAAGAALSHACSM